MMITHAIYSLKYSRGYAVWSFEYCVHVSSKPTIQFTIALSGGMGDGSLWYDPFFWRKSVWCFKIFHLKYLSSWGYLCDSQESQSIMNICQYSLSEALDEEMARETEKSP